jgi:hypothetical protein
MRLSANRIRSVNLRIAQAEASAFPGFGRNTRRLPLNLKPAIFESPIQGVGDVVLAKILAS